MRLITEEGQHEKHIVEHLQKSNVVNIAVAFLKKSGLQFLHEHILTSLKKGSDITIVAGLNFAQTEPVALKEVWELANKHENCKLYLALPKNKQQIFHPKIYHFITATNVTLIIGSANFTSGGLSKNHECSVLTTNPPTDRVSIDAERYFKNLLKADFCVEATMTRIKQYEKYYNEQRVLYSGIKEKPLGQLADIKYNDAALTRYFKDYQRSEDIVADFSKRVINYKEAKKILDSIADTKSLTKNLFIPLYEQLVGSKEYYNLWHSGSIFRGKTKAFECYKEFQNLVLFIRENKRKSQAYVFNNAKELVSHVNGCGINTVTEIMMTYNPVDFANLNKNPITVLEKVAEVYFKRSRNSFNGQDYEEYCALLKDIIKAFNLGNMLAIDSFFNFIYWILNENELH